MANPHFNTQVAPSRSGSGHSNRKPGTRVEKAPEKLGFQGVSMPGGTQSNRSAGVKPLQTYPQRKGL